MIAKSKVVPIAHKHSTEWYSHGTDRFGILNIHTLGFYNVELWASQSLAVIHYNKLIALITLNKVSL